MSENKNNFDDLLIKLNNINYESNIIDGQLINSIIDNQLKNSIKQTIINYFPKLYIDDVNILFVLTTYLIDVISYKYNITEQIQWTKNYNRDIRGVLLLLLPFIDSKNNNELPRNLLRLNNILYSSDKILENKDFLKNVDRDKMIEKYFKNSNIGISLLDDKTTYNIYDIIHNNFLAILQTVEMINGKHYINWLNMSPLNLDNYDKSVLYLETEKKYNNLKLDELDKPMLYYKGLWVGDIYNVIRNRLYRDIKPVKWLIFQYSKNNEIYENKNKDKYLIEILNEILDINSVISSNKYYYLLSEDIKNSFVKNTDYNFEKEKLESIKYFIIYFIFNYSKINKIDRNELLGIKIKDENINILDDKDDSDFNESIIEIIKNIKPNEIFKKLIENYISDVWDFLKETIVYLKTTWYYMKLIDNNKISPNNQFLKSIYNISKTLSHNSQGKDKDKGKNTWELLPENYLSLSSQYKIDFFTKLKLNTGKDWLNLKQNHKRQYSFSLNKKPYETFIDSILGDYRTNILNYVFEVLIYGGILNEFRTNNDLTNNAICNEINSKKKYINYYFKNKLDWDKSYYYINNTKYGELDKQRIEVGDKYSPYDKYKEKDFFETILQYQRWIEFYALDWICQIDFFKHYIFNQVLYVTGATGQGKSTQVPKLLLYASMMIDYRDGSKIICTQPRVSPTVENATRISDELGVSIEILSNKVNYKTRTNNYFVQYKHQKDSHVNNTRNFLRIVTDGTLYEEMKNNILLLKKFGDEYYNENIYDTLIIDEAHEHNTNMDLILAMARQTCYHNNKIKLIIVSATMDDDEPIYRRYYKTINDNISFPIINNYIHPILEIPYFINCKLLDRRFHIALPGATTQYKIDEKYVDVDEYDKTKFAKYAKDAQQNAIQKAVDICNTTSEGNILIFNTGEAEIYDSIERLNKLLPPGCVALPYLSQMNEEYKKIIAKIGTRISSIRNKRDKIHLEWGLDFIEDITVPFELYKRAVIIATNVAEASITIPKLKFVIDNGYSKVNRYNKKIFSSVLEVDKISESSRLQRKGRVGRIDSGDVIYMYSQDSRKYIKPKYQITQENISMKILDLASTHTINNINDNVAQPLLPSVKINYNGVDTNFYFSPNSSVFYKEKVYDKINKSQLVTSKLFDIYKTNYIDCINKDKLENYNFINDIFSFLVVNNNGQLITNLFDTTGEFYLIHPLELNIKRNIYNNIIEYKYVREDTSDIIINTNEIIIKTSEIPQNEFMYILKYLIHNNLLIDKQSKKIFMNESDINLNMANYIKTELADFIIELSPDISKYLGIIDKGLINQYCLTIMASVGMGCYNEVVELIILTTELNMNLGNIYGGSFFNWNSFKTKNRYLLKNNIDSDLIFLHIIIKKIKEKFGNLIYYNESIKQSEFNILYNKFKKNYKEPNDNYSSYIWNNLTMLSNTGRLEEGFNELYNNINESNVIDILENNIVKNEKIIKEWCELYELNFNVIINFIKKLSIFNWNDNLIKNEVFRTIRKMDNSFNRLLTTNTIEEKIVRSFLYGTPYNYTFLVNENTIKGIKGIYCNFANEYVLPINDNNIVTMTDNLTLFSFVSNNPRGINKIDENRDFVNPFLLSKIDIRWLIPVNPFYFNSNFKHSMVMYNFSTIKYYSSNDINLLDNTIANSWDMNCNVWNSKHIPLIEYYYNNLLSKN